jgi:hypothetical protein
MRSLLTVWLLTLLSLTSLSAAAEPSYACHSEGAFCATEESRTRRAEILRRYAAQNDNDRMPITFDEYWQLVRDTEQVILQMETKPEATIRQELDALAIRWDQVTIVALSDGSEIQIDSAYLTAQLRLDPPDLKRLGNLLDALLRAHEQYPQKVFTLEHVVPLKEILTRPEFQWQQQQPLQLPNWLERFFVWIEQFRNRTLNTAYRYGRVPLIIAATLIFIVSLFFISRGLSRSLVKEAELETEGNESDGMLTSKGALKRAETLSTQGDYRNAIRYLYLSSLLVLDEQGLMRYDRSRTNREYLRSVSSKPELAKPLRDVIDVFDRVWYGFETVDEQTYQSYVRRVDELREKKE